VVLECWKMQSEVGKAEMWWKVWKVENYLNNFLNIALKPNSAGSRS